MIRSSRKKVIAIILTCLVWLATWAATHGFYMSSYLQDLVPGSINIQILTITAYIFIAATVILSVLRSQTKKFLPFSQWLWLYLLPLICIITLQFTYQGPLDLWVFILMITISVFWQDALTFGLFQNYIRQSASRWNTILIVGTLFGLGHIMAFAPDMTQLLNPGFYLLFIVGYLFAWLREKTGNIYVIDVLHMTFLLAAMIGF